MRAAVEELVEELMEMVRQRYPEAQFHDGRDPDDPQIVLITAVVDLDDPDEVTDLVIERENQLLIDEGLPVYVIPVRTPERVQATVEAARAARSGHRPLAVTSRRECDDRGIPLPNAGSVGRHLVRESPAQSGVAQAGQGWTVPGPGVA